MPIQVNRKIAIVACTVGAILTGAGIVFSGTCADSMLAALTGSTSWDCQLVYGGWHHNTPGQKREGGAIIIIALAVLFSVIYGTFWSARRLFFWCERKYSKNKS